MNKCFILDIHIHRSGHLRLIY